MKATRIFNYFVNDKDNLIDEFTDKELIKYIQDAENELIDLEKNFKLSKIFNVLLYLCVIGLLVIK